ncbi:MAG: response regulator, partial [Campylobacterales bacterium]|nr:response regulator [Campylobacterales bacterium]
MKKNIIIVEYSKSVDKLISFVLEERGYQVLHASSFEELLNIENEILETSIGFCEAIMAYEEENKSLDYLLDKGVPTIALIDDMDYENFKFKDGVVDLIIKGDIYSIVEKITNSIIRLEHNSQIKILLVDDSESFRSLVKANLENSLFQVLEANDGDVGLEVIKENEDIHLVITDFYMPNMIGTDLIKNIREFATKENLPIIGISSDDKTTSQFLQAGANDYINKNFTNEEFLSRVYNGLELVEKFHEIEKGKILLEQYKKSVDESNIVSKTDLKGKITYVNDRFCQISGYTREELIGQSHNIVRHPDISNAVYKELWEAIKDKRTWRGIIKNRAKDGGTYYVDSFIMPILDNKGNVKEYMSVRHDISKVVEQEQQIRKNFSDPMTGMANRQKLFKDLEDFENNKSFLLSFIDIDDFSNINDF